LDLSDCYVDAIEVSRAAAAGIEMLGAEPLQELAALFDGDFLDGLEIDRSPVFNGWLTAERRRFRGYHAALLEQLTARVPDNEAFGYLDKRLQLAPFDPRIHEALLSALARHGRIREGEEHVAATVRLFAAEGLDDAPIRDAWRAARAQGEGPLLLGAVASPPTAAPRPDAAMEPRRASIAVMPFAD